MLVLNDISLRIAGKLLLEGASARSEVERVLASVAVPRDTK